MRAFPLLLILLAGPALAQTPGGGLVWEIDADLDGDGQPERYTLVGGATEGTVDLSVETPAGLRVAEGIAWTGGMAGQEPTLGLNPAGSVTLTSMNDSVGRDRWTLTLTIAHREGDWRVAGVTYEFRDTLDLNAYGGCDVNLLTGEGTAWGPGGEHAVSTGLRAPLLWDWTDRDQWELMPSDCYGEA